MSQLLTPIITTVRKGPWIQVGCPGGFEITEITLPIRDLPARLQGLRICHLTDMHLRAGWCSAYDEFLGMLKRDEPDLVLCTGDFVESKFDHRVSLPTLARFIEGLRARIGVFAILGNHDGDLLAPIVEATHVHLIEGRCVELADAEAALELVGLPGVWRSDLRQEFIDAVPPKRAGVPRIVLAHFPDHLPRIGKMRADLMLAGHTHGGQICLPGGRPIITHDSMPRAMSQGLHRVDETWLLVNRGLGFASHQVRLFCPAQVVWIELVRGA